MTAGTDEPIACTLQPDALDDRRAEWASVLAGAGARTTLPDGRLRIELPGADAGALGRVVAAEQHCCAFFAFTITIDARGIALEVGAPEGAKAVVAELFGPAD
ncbi:MAG: hypothetical protein M3487_12550 [Actinomycetota bacterium]|nr:hypothetical protein [Actinomycetota bacterium]